MTRQNSRNYGWKVVKWQEPNRIEVTKQFLACNLGLLIRKVRGRNSYTLSMKSLAPNGPVNSFLKYSFGGSDGTIMDSMNPTHILDYDDLFLESIEGDRRQGDIEMIFNEARTRLESGTPLTDLKSVSINHIRESQDYINLNGGGEISFYLRTGEEEKKFLRSQSVPIIFLGYRGGINRNGRL